MMGHQTSLNSNKIYHDNMESQAESIRLGF